MILFRKNYVSLHDRSGCILCPFISVEDDDDLFGFEHLYLIPEDINDLFEKIINCKKIASYTIIT